jgi:AcrR family transcriptional regulator
MARTADPDLDLTVMQAVADVLVEEGYDGMSVDRVAARARVGRATIYRRWSTKADMVAAAMKMWLFEHIDAPDTGDVRADFEKLLSQVLVCMTDESPVVQAVLVEKARHPELAEAMERDFLPERRAVLKQVLERGIERGQLPPDTDVDLIADAGPALAWSYRTRLGQKPPPDLPARIVRQFLPER